MLSAAGARNIQDRVRNAPRKSLGRSISSRKQVTEKPTDVKENQPNGLRRSASAGTSKRHHPGFKHFENTSSTNNNIDNTKHERRTRSISVKREKIQGGIVEMKQRSKSSVDRMKQRSKSGADRVKQGGTDMLQRRPSIKLRTQAPPLPSRSLFQHKPRTWFGTKKGTEDKVKEDWRSARPPTNSANSQRAAKKSDRKEEHGKQDFKRSCSTGTSALVCQQPIGRSRSAPSKVSFAKEDWVQYLVD